MNKCYIITYDLMNPGKNYEPLYTAIKSYEAWGKITNSCWMVITNDVAVNIRSRLLAHIDPNDRIFISRLCTPAAWQNTKADDNWVKTNLEAFGI